MNTIAIDQQRRILSSWKEVAAYLGTGVRTAQRYEGKLAFPIRRPYSRNRSSVIALVDEVDLWLRSMRKGPAVEPQIAEPSQPRTLHSWKEIADYVNRGVRTVQRYRRDLGFPVYSPNGNSRGCVLAFTQEIDDWLRSTAKAGRIPEPTVVIPQSEKIRTIVTGRAISSLSSKAPWAKNGIVPVQKALRQRRAAKAS